MTERTERDGGLAFRIQTALPTKEMRLGDSIAVNGCCLTVEQKDAHEFSVFLSEETLRCTTFRDAGKGQHVNLERSLLATSRLDGHVVQGHVEGIATLVATRSVGESIEWQVEIPALHRGALIPKGSIALQGVSLTINHLTDLPSRSVLVGINLIPHTLEKTNLSGFAAGHRLHLETDLFGRYAERLLLLSRS